MSTTNLNLKPTVNGFRDAVHVAVIAASAGVVLKRGQAVDIIVGENGEVTAVAVTKKSSSIGIVNPFHDKAKLKVGEQFWLMLYPETITGMTHHWEHPALKKAEKKAQTSRVLECENWLDDYCRLNFGMSWENVREVIEDPHQETDNGYISDGCFVVRGTDACHHVSSEFWLKVAVVIEDIGKLGMFNYVSCTC